MFVIYGMLPGNPDERIIAGVMPALESFFIRLGVRGGTAEIEPPVNGGYLRC